MINGKFNYTLGEYNRRIREYRVCGNYDLREYVMQLCKSIVLCSDLCCTLHR